MEKGINFFREYRSQIKKREKKRFVVQVFSITILSVYLFVVLVIIAFLLYFKNQEKKLNQGIEQATKEIEDLRPIETKQVYLAEKIKSLEQIFSQREEHQKIAQSFFSLLPLGVSVTGFSIDEVGQIQFVIKSDTFVGLNEFFSRLYSSEEYTELPLSLADLNAFSFRTKSGYTLNMKLGFLKE